MNKLEIKNINKLRKIFALSLALSTASLTGCGENKIVEDKTEMYDYIDSNDEEIRIKPQEVDVPEEDFKLIVEYQLNDKTTAKWRINDNKEITVKVSTKNLPESTKVWIDNIHTDVSIVATSEEMDGIPQDSLDDRIHNSLMYGFPLSDKTHYVANWKIEGMNKDFIEGSSIGFENYSDGSIKQERYTEEKYLEKGVYANMISSSYGLLIQKGNNEPYGVDASSNFMVLINNKVTVEDDDEIITRVYDKYGNYEIIEEQKTVKVKKAKIFD